MSQENVEAVKSMYAGFSELARGADVAAYVAAHYEPDCEYHPVEEAAAIRGHEELVSWNRRWLEAWGHFRAEVEETIEAGDVVVARVRVEGRGRDSGMKIGQRICHSIELRNRQILRMHEFLEWNAALEAAGLSE